MCFWHMLGCVFGIELSSFGTEAYDWLLSSFASAALGVSVISEECGFIVQEETKRQFRDSVTHISHFPKWSPWHKISLKPQFQVLVVTYPNVLRRGKAHRFNCTRHTSDELLRSSRSFEQREGGSLPFFRTKRIKVSKLLGAYFVSILICCCVLVTT